MPQKAVFLDRDGTIIVEKEYLSDPGQVELLPSAGEGIARLRHAGFLAVMTSNQSGVARGFFNEEDVARVNDHLQGLLKEYNAALDGIYYCPHHVNGTIPALSQDCDCRKPKPGMINQAVKDLDVDLTASWVVGDKVADILFGRRLGLKTVLVLTGYGKEVRDKGLAPAEKPDYIAQDLGEAADLILSQKQS